MAFKRTEKGVLHRSMAMTLRKLFWPKRVLESPKEEWVDMNILEVDPASSDLRGYTRFAEGAKRGEYGQPRFAAGGERKRKRSEADLEGSSGAGAEQQNQQEEPEDGNEDVATSSASVTLS